MARIRTVKPDFWEDEVIASISRDARLLFIATFNMADDEGLLRWTAAYIKAQAFIYDDDIDVHVTASLMGELTEARLLFPYVGGQVRQQLAYVVNFRKHQKINRPQPSKLPPPSLQNPEVRRMYGQRDRWICHLCKNPIERDDLNLDHLQPRVAGGSDYPSNIAAAHASCNKGRGDRGIPALILGPVLGSVDDALTDSRNGSVNDSADGAAPFTGGRGRGRGREGDQGGGTVADATEPPLRCSRHINSTDDAPCGACGDARRAHDRWVRAQKNKPTPTAGPGSKARCPKPEHEREIAASCRLCRSEAIAQEAS